MGRVMPIGGVARIKDVDFKRHRVSVMDVPVDVRRANCIDDKPDHSDLSVDPSVIDLIFNLEISISLGGVLPKG
jgi:hypothetical protein